jgi:hypothetical protein
VEFQSFVFKQIWADFGQFWAEIAALTVAAQSVAEIFKTP